MKKIMLSAAATIACLSLAAVIGLSQDQEPLERKGKGPCRADVEKFCKGVQPGGGRIARCLKNHESELSEECAAHVARVSEKFKEARDACSGDVKKFCQDVRPGKGRIISCLKSHEAELSEACRATLEKKQ